MPAVVMGLLAGRLALAGYAPHLFAYRGRRPLDGSVERLARYVFETCRDRPAHFVGHSLGGLLVLETLNRHANIGVGRVVLLGAPVGGCLSGRRLAKASPGRWMLGASAPLWSEERDAHWRRDAPLGVLAGTRPIGLGRTFGPLPGANDGVVRVEETMVEGMTERVLVPRSHSGMVASGQVAKLVARFLASGTFREPAA